MKKLKELKEDIILMEFGQGKPKLKLEMIIATMLTTNCCIIIFNYSRF